MNTIPSNPTLFDIEQTAEYLNTTVRHVRRLVESKAITVIKVGRLIRISQFDVDAYLEANRREAVGKQ